MKKKIITVALVLSSVCAMAQQKENRDTDGSILRGPYDPKTECIYLNLEETDLSKISLDVSYRCTVFLGEEAEECVGRVRERFLGKSGNILILQIENGFYKININ